MTLFWIISDLKKIPKQCSEELAILCSIHADERDLTTIPVYIKSLPEGSFEKRLLLQFIQKWFEKTTDEGNEADGLAAIGSKHQLAVWLDLKEEQLAITIRRLQSCNEEGYRSFDEREYSILEFLFLTQILCNLGDCSHLSLVEPFLDNTNPITISDRGEETQFRDLVLPVAVYLTGQPLKEYHLARALEEGHIFADGSKRGAAFAKWNAWVKDNPIQEVEQTAK